MTETTETKAQPGRERLNRRDKAALVVLLAGIPLMAFALRGVRIENDVEQWLPEEDSGSLILDWHYEHFSPQERFLVGWDSNSLDDPRVERLAALLAGPPDREGFRAGHDPRIERVSTPRDLLQRMHENRIPLAESIRRCVGVSIGHGALKIELTDDGRTQPELTFRKIADTLVELGVAPILMPPLRRADVLPAGESAQPDDPLHRASLLDIAEHDLQVRWKGLTPDGPLIEEIRNTLPMIRQNARPLVKSVFFAPGAPVAVTIVLTQAGSDDVTGSVAVVRAAADEVGIPLDELRMGGAPIGRSRLNREAIRALWNTDYPAWNLYKRSPVLLSALVGALLAMVMLRGVRLTAIVLFAATYVACATVALVPLMGDTLNMVLVVMPNLMLVVTMSGAIHIINYWRHELDDDGDGAVSRAVRTGLAPCTLASVTTAIGTASLATSTLLPIRSFGLYSTVGVLGSLAMVLLGVPALLKLAGPGSRGRRAPSSRNSGWRTLGWFTSKYHVAIQFLLTVVFLQSVWGMQWLRTETKVIRYFPDHLRIVEDYDFFEQLLAGVVNVDVLVHFNESAIAETDIVRRLETVRAIETALQNQPGVTGTLSVADFRRTLEPPAEDEPLRVKLLYRQGLRRMRAGIFQLPFGSSAAPDPVEASEPDAAPSGSVASSSLATLVRRPLQLEHDGRNVDFREGDEVWRIRVHCNVLGDINYSSLLAQVDLRVRESLGDYPGADFVITGSVPLFLHAQQELLRSLITSFGLAVGLITLMVMLLLRSVRGGLYAMLPNLFPVGVSFGTLAWMKVPIDVGTMMTASIALGLAIDATLHLITWFEDSLERERHRSSAVKESLLQCGPAVFQTSVIIAFGMFMLSGADLLLISRFGWLMALLALTALVSDIVLLPALLASRMGELLRPRKIMRKPRGASSRKATELAGQPAAESGGAD
ncbi:MAG: MMPL family transporter [Planctomyces sp.]|nr:MMPL family transporter [Planctomyces sp.]